MSAFVKVKNSSNTTGFYLQRNQKGFSFRTIKPHYVKDRYRTKHKIDAINSSEHRTLNISPNKNQQHIIYARDPVEKLEQYRCNQKIRRESLKSYSNRVTINYLNPKKLIKEQISAELPKIQSSKTRYRNNRSMNLGATINETETDKGGILKKLKPKISIPNFIQKQIIKTIQQESLGILTDFMKNQQPQKQNCMYHNSERSSSAKEGNQIRINDSSSEKKLAAQLVSGMQRKSRDNTVNKQSKAPTKIKRKPKLHQFTAKANPKSIQDDVYRYKLEGWDVDDSNHDF